MGPGLKTPARTEARAEPKLPAPVGVCNPDRNVHAKR